MRALFETVIKHVPAPVGDSDGPFQLQISALDYSSYVGRLGIGRIRRGRIAPGQEVAVLNGPLAEGEMPKKAKIGQLFSFAGMERVPIETAEVGDGCTIYQGVTLGGTSLYRGEKRHPTLAAGVVVGAGAKVLGGFTVGEGAKIGSNAVVVKAVPAGATVVGIPGRIVEEARGEQAAERFAAYAVVQDQDDPQAKAIQSLIEHSRELEQALAALRERLARVEREDAGEGDKNIRIVK
jgi:serine O-acetyltransferase